MASGVPVSIPYCGAAPSPAELWSRWNGDPVLIVALIVFGCAYAVGARRANRTICPLAWQAQACFYLGLAVGAAALLSPLCALSVSLFSARVGQHMVLALVAAPLAAAARPMVVLRGLLTGRASRRLTSAPSRLTPIGAAGLFALLLWLWHAPVPYAATFASSAVYWSMHISMFGGALWLWSCLLDSAPSRAMSVVGAGMISTVQMGFIGALITFAPRPLYAPHLLTTEAWGLTPLQDQQLGGAIMWVPGCLMFLAVSMLVLWRAAAAGDWQPRRGPGLGAEAP